MLAGLAIRLQLRDVRLEVRGPALVIVLDDGSEHVVDGVTVPRHVDHGRVNTYGTELRAQWGEAHVHRHGDALVLYVDEILEGCGDVGVSPHGYWQSGDGGRTWARDPRPPLPTRDTLIAAVSTHPSVPAVYGVR